MSKKEPRQPKTAFGRYMQEHFIPNFANNVQGLVYYGASILVIIVGLRGLGTVAGKIAIVPKFLLAYDPDLDGFSVSPTWVMFALFLEFFLLLLMATTIFFTPEEEGHAHHSAPHTEENKASAPVDMELEKVAEQVRNKIREVAQEEVKVMDAYLEKIHRQHSETLSKILQQPNK